MLLESLHDQAGLSPMRRCTDLKMNVRPRQPELLEEDVRHDGVVVLPCVNELEVPPSGGSKNRGSLHEVRPSAHNKDN